MLSERQIQDTIREHVNAENDIDVDRVLATYTRQSPILEDVAAGIRCVGAEQIIGEYRNVWGGFPGLARRITRWTLGEDSAVIEVTVAGKHEGAFRGIPATGRDVSLRGIAHFQFDSEGRIQQETVYYDILSLMHQLGVSTVI